MMDCTISDQEPATRFADLDAQLARVNDLLVVDPVQAEQAARDAVTHAQALGDSLRTGRARVLLGGTLFFQARYDESLEAFQQALTAARAHGDRVLEARALNGLGNVVSHQGDYAGALEHFMQSSRVALESGDELGRVRVLNNIAAVWSELGEHGNALQSHQEVETVAVQLGDDSLYSSACINVMVDHCKLGEYKRAQIIAEEILPRLQAKGMRQHQVVAQAYRAHSLWQTGHVAAAQQVILDHLPLAEEIGEQAHLTFMLTMLATTYQEQNKNALALTLLDRALGLAQEYHIRNLEKDTLGILSEVREALGDYRGALADLRAHHTLERQIHAENVDRKTRFMTAQFEFETLRRESERERQRTQQLLKDHTALQEDHLLLAHVAAQDPLTGLANRAHFQKVAEQTLQQSVSTNVGLLYLDLDGFKQVNDTLGHDAGDDLLRQVAARLQAQVRRGDLVARPGGDEFTVLLPHLRQPCDAQQIGHKLLGVLTQPFTVKGQEVNISASVGAAVAPQDGLVFAELQRRADEAMYRVKRSGRNGVMTTAFPELDSACIVRPSAKVPGQAV